MCGDRVERLENEVKRISEKTATIPYLATKEELHDLNIRMIRRELTTYLWSFGTAVGIAILALVIASAVL